MPFVSDWRWFWGLLVAQFMMQLLGAWGFQSRGRRTASLRKWVVLSWGPVLSQFVFGWKGAIVAAILWFFPFSYIAKVISVWLMRKVTGYSNSDLEEMVAAELLRDVGFQGVARPGGVPMAGMTDIAERVNSLLTAYVAIHNDVFRGNVWTFIPRVFAKIDFCQHRESLTQISAELRTCEIALAEVSQSYTGTVLARYIPALTATVYRLQRIVDSLCRKSQGVYDYSWGQYNRDCNEYRELQQDYTEIGALLNEAIHNS